jgi:hypothetical protein
VPSSYINGAARFNINVVQNDYKDLQLTAFNAAGVSVLTNAATLDGQQLKQAPKSQYSLSTSYRVPVGNGAMVLGAQMKHVREHFQNLTSSPTRGG